MTPRRFVLLAALLGTLLGPAACTRTSDGSVVPTYRLDLERNAPVPYLTWKRTPVDRAPPLGVFPAPPGTAVAEAAPPRERAPARRREARRAPEPAPREPHLYRCRTETRQGGRVGMDCR